MWNFILYQDQLEGVQEEVKGLNFLLYMRGIKRMVFELDFQSKQGFFVFQKYFFILLGKIKVKKIKNYGNGEIYKYGMYKII